MTKGWLHRPWLKLTHS